MMKCLFPSFLPHPYYQRSAALMAWRSWSSVLYIFVFQKTLKRSLLLTIIQWGYIIYGPCRMPSCVYTQMYNHRHPIWCLCVEQLKWLVLCTHPNLLISMYIYNVTECWRFVIGMCPIIIWDPVYDFIMPYMTLDKWVQFEDRFWQLMLERVECGKSLKDLIMKAFKRPPN